ncbi:MAG: DUF1302 family protein [Candidatus Binatia bacterium]
MRRSRFGIVGGLFTWLIVGGFGVGTAWGYFFDERREMSLSGFAYSRGTFALSEDDIGNYKGLWQKGNLVQHRNFLSLEWRHNVNRLSREFPVTSVLAEFLNFDALDYYLNARFEYDGVWEYGPSAARRLRRGGPKGQHWGRALGAIPESYPGQFVRYDEFEFESSRRRIKELLAQFRLFEWYVNITKGPLFIRFGKQNLSWGEADVFRLLDQINPLDNNFGGFTTALDERRIPLDMLRAQWSFGTVGPVQDLTLEGFVSIDQETAARTTVQGCFFCSITNTAPIEIGRTPCGGHQFAGAAGGRTQQNPLGIPCSDRAYGPHSSLRDVRGGGRITGTISDFTFSLAHYYTWSDQSYVRARIISPSPEHLLWDTNGLGNPDLVPAVNPWGPNDPVWGINGPGTPGAIVNGRSAFGSPAGFERNARSAVEQKRVQITGASLSFPVNALTGMFVGSDNPLYYIYTTFRGEIAYTQNLPFSYVAHDLETGAAFGRFLAPTIAAGGGNANALFLPGGAFASEGNCQREDGQGIRGCRAGSISKRDRLAFVIGFDHNQWIRWINKSNSVSFSAQLFVQRDFGLVRNYQRGVPVGLLNDRHAPPLVNRNEAPVDPNGPLAGRPGGPGLRAGGCTNADGSTTPPCDFKRLVKQPELNQVFTLIMSTPYRGGNVRPSLVFLYVYSGSWLVQPGIDWNFWDPFRMQVRYNYIDGRQSGIGFFKTKDSIWLELQYLLY